MEDNIIKTNFKRFFALLISIVLCLSVKVSAFVAENVSNVYSTTRTLSGSASLVANDSREIKFQVRGKRSLVAHAKIIVSGIPAGNGLTVQVRRPNGQSISEEGGCMFWNDQTFDQVFYIADTGMYQFTATPGPTNGFWYTIIVDIEG